jgi:ABC-2 type transport system ATP-binding protein
MAVLAVEDLKYSYNGVVTVLDNVTFRVGTGSIVGLLGPNGSGKSTLIKNVFDLLRLQSGRITIDGHEHASTEAKSRGMYLASNDYLPQFLTAREYIETLGKMYGVSVEESAIYEMFLRFSMEGRHDDLIEGYSHGMRKKTQLISAFLMRRPLTVIDETFNGVDLEALYLCERELVELRKDGLAVLLCTHDFALLERLADRILFLDFGEIVVDHDIEKVLAMHDSLEKMVSRHLDSRTV